MNARTLNLCFSVDIRDSTSSKCATVGKNGRTHVWPSFFEHFYSRFTSEATKIHGIQAWKANGDELLFYRPLDGNTIETVGESISDFLELVRRFRKSTEAVCTELLQINTPDKPGFKVDLKCTVWCAPVPRRNVPINYNGVCDFIGPDIDLGFRLSTHSNPQETAICPITALLMVKFPNERNPHIRFNGFHSLKGFQEQRPIIFVSDAINPDHFGLGEASNLEECLEKYVSRLYPNVVIDGLESFSEDAQREDLQCDETELQQIDEIVLRLLPGDV